LDQTAGTWLCLVCGCETAPRDDLDACPTCGDTGTPADTATRVCVSLTWHELRILVIWAERFAAGAGDARMAKVLYGIADRLQLQHLDAPALTLQGEISELASRGHAIAVDDEGTEGGAR
jgi:hypothetical protein